MSTDAPDDFIQIPKIKPLGSGWMWASKVVEILSIDEGKVLADIFFPEIKNTITDLELKYPPRNRDFVSRFAPSPTGFMHIWGIYNALVAEKFVHSNGGIFMLRIEDTDQKREVPWAVQWILNAMQNFWIVMDEFPGNPQNEWRNYWPYIQSERKLIYQTFAKDLVIRWLAYPCFLTGEEVESIREKQEMSWVKSWIYGEYSPWKNASKKDVIGRLSQWDAFVLRFHSPCFPGDRTTVIDEIHWEITMDDNVLDIVLLKTDGIPTYHFAHVVDDYLMRTTHVIRGDEWISSLPLHIQLFNAFGITPPKYVHMAPLMKLEEWNKRKLSKRKDPEANVEYFFEQGYPQWAVIEYLCNIMDARFEDWRMKNPHLPISEFPFDIKSLSKSGALFDRQKLTSVSNAYISRLPHDDLLRVYLEWLKQTNEKLYQYFIKFIDILRQAISIERLSDKDPKRYSRFSDITPLMTYFVDDLFDVSSVQFPSNIPDINRAWFLKSYLAYLQSWDHFWAKDKWFEDIRNIWINHWFAQDNNQYRAGGFIWKIADSTMILRTALTTCTKTQDLFEIMRVMGVDRCIKRLEAVIEHSSVL
jgi:glutamyl-tRNA synthetase